MRATVIAIASVMLVLGCAGAPSVDCNKLSNDREKDVCVYNQSMTQMSSAICTGIVNETMRAGCIDYIAVKMLDYLPCKQHDKQAWKDRCESKVSEARKAAREADPNVRLP